MIKETCREYSISTKSLNNWINQVQPKEKISKKPIITNNKSINDEIEDKKDAEEISKLRKENENRICVEISNLACNAKSGGMLNWMQLAA